ncbi:hypothetical protein ACFE04_024256 [Oxalis oulophora]
MNQTSIQESFYDVLSVQENATYDEIRASYRSAIIYSHPDKLHNKTYEQLPIPDDESGDRFLKVQKAWEILGDSKSRLVYDSQLRASRHDSIAADDVSIEEMTVEDTGDMVELFYPCRCGDYFCTDSLDLEKVGCNVLRNGNRVSIVRSESLPVTIILPCGSCSLHVRLLINRDYEVSIDSDS